MSPFEIGMLICFGASWPLSILKLWRTKRSDGKSRLFGVIVLIGYICGILHKLFFSLDIVILLYVVNLVLISFDLYLVLLYRNNKGPQNVSSTEH